jgi:hypothetical protein
MIGADPFALLETVDLDFENSYNGVLARPRIDPDQRHSEEVVAASAQEAAVTQHTDASSDVGMSECIGNVY